MKGKDPREQKKEEKKEANEEKANEEKPEKGKMDDEEHPKLFNFKNYATFGKQEKEEDKPEEENSADELELSFEMKQNSSQETKSEPESNKSHKFEDTFGQMNEATTEQPQIPPTQTNSKNQSTRHIQTKDILIQEGLFKSESDLFKNKFEDGEQNIEVLDLKFDRMESSSPEPTSHSRSDPECAPQDFNKKIFGGSLKTTRSKFFSHKTKQEGNCVVFIGGNKSQRVVSGKEQSNQGSISQKRMSHSSNLELSSLKHLLSNLKRNIFQGKEHFQNKRRNRFHSNCGVSIKTESQFPNTSSKLEKKNKSVKAKARKLQVERNKRRKTPAVKGSRMKKEGKRGNN